MFSQHSLEEDRSRGNSYKKRPLYSPKDPRSRGRRVEHKMSVLQQWAEEESVDQSVLLGCLLYIENMLMEIGPILLLVGKSLWEN